MPRYGAHVESIARWFEVEISRGRACQPSPTGFPLATTVVADVAAPVAVLEAAQFYRGAIGDGGDAWIHRQSIGGSDVFFVHLGTDGDEGALEVFDVSGSSVASAYLDGQTVTWQETDVVRTRFVHDE